MEPGRTTAASGQIREFQREECPVCRHNGWCGRRDDGLVLCKRPPTPRDVPGLEFRGMAGDGTTAMYVEFGANSDCGRPRRPLDASASPKGPRQNRPNLSTGQLNEMQARFVAAFDGERRQALADALGLPGAALDALSIGWWGERRWWNPATEQEEGEPGCWTFPEHDAQGRVIGVGLRWPPGQKGQLSGGRRGLTLPGGWRELPDPIIVVEGPSDALAGRTVGLNVIGRPSNSGGADLLTALCRNRRVIILGENDRKPDGRWPGKEGAEAVARRLEAVWGRPAPVALPPEGIKDLREWVLTLAPEPALGNTESIRTEVLNALLPPPLLWLVGPSDGRGRVVVKVFRCASGPEATPIHTDRLHLDQESARKRFARAVARAEPGADVDEIADRLLRLAASPAQQPSGERVGSDLRQSPSTISPALDASGNDLPVVFLPGGPVAIQESAQKLGGLLAATEAYFLRGGSVVTVARDDTDHAILETLRPAGLASVFETVARLAVFTKRFGELAAQPAACTEQQAKLIEHCEGFRHALPLVRLLSPCPVLVERRGELVAIHDYDQESGIMVHVDPPLEVPLEEAVPLLDDMLSDFRFATPADRARASAALVTPALVMGGLLDGRAPVDLGEADASQTGKGYRNKLTAAVYNDTVRTVTQKKGGVGSLEESFATALIRGRNFISLDNMRGQIDSPAIESFLTEDSYLARIPHMTAVEIDPRRIILQLTSNRADITVDMANRASCVRILKQPEGYCFRKYAEGDLLDRVRAHQPQYLGAVFAVVRAWHRVGKPRTDETRHDFRPWARTLDWIVQNLFRAGPLLDGHRETQLRMATPSLNWLRDVALAVRDSVQLDQWLRAAQLVAILAGSPSVDLPGLADGDDLNDDETRSKVLQAVGRKLGQCFREQGVRAIDGFKVERRELADPGQRRPIREYRFRAIDPVPDGCAYARERSERIGADQAQDRPKPSEGAAECAAAPAASPVCAYGAPIGAPIDAPIKTAVAPNAPMGSGIGKKDHQKTRMFENRCVKEMAHIGEVGPHRRIGALGATRTLPLDTDPVDPSPERPPVPAPIPRPPPVAPTAAWLSAGTTDVPPMVIELAARRDGWTPESWRDRLLQLADRCEDEHADRAAELRHAAAVMTCVQGDPADV